MNNSQRPTLSVVLSCYNSMHAIEQLRSLRGQHELADEIIVIDDSTDGTIYPALERELANHTSRIVLHRNSSNLGMWASYNRALAMATSDLIATCDHDDFWFPDKLSVVRTALLDPTVAGVTSDGVVMISDAKIDPPSSPNDGSFLTQQGWSPAKRQHLQSVELDFLLRRNMLSGTSLVFRRELLEKMLPLPSDMFPDHWLACCIAASGLLQLLDIPLFRYRIHPGNAVGIGEPSRKRSEQLRIPLARLSTETTNRLREMNERAAGVVDSYEQFLDVRQALRTGTRQQLIRTLRKVPLSDSVSGMRKFYPSGSRAVADVLRLAVLLTKGRGIAATSELVNIEIPDEII